ncbi:MAG: T9SS type A sorting domain-containing protein, partial [Candidatus Poribacteria bacterium]|nr:T9SS type A sorting domain-containing protein [Candidatus Poribacteria bacterium]
LASAQGANILGVEGTVNCPVVSVEEIIEGPKDPATASRAVIDRFSADAGTLFVRDDSGALPAADEPIDFDQPPFITQGFGPDGQVVKYYNFDVQNTEPASIFVLFHEGESEPVDGQIFIVDVIPGDPGYNDFWNVTKVTVPTDYVANTVTSLDEIQAAGYAAEATDQLVNCPMVPEGSTAMLRLGDGNTGLNMGWYRGQVVTYFSFEEKALAVDAGGMVPVSVIHVSFNINPGEDGGGPASGFVTEPETVQTHNVIATVPSDADYSPLWVVTIYDNADFDAVSDLASAQGANILGGEGTVNCPIVSVEEIIGEEGVFFMTLDPGLNMISLPLMPPTPYTASRLAEEIGATIVVKMDSAQQKFVGFTADSSEEGFLIEGGKGYIVNLPDARTVPFVGSAWSNSPEVAPAGPPIDRPGEAWAFVVSGDVQHAEMGSNYTVVVKNLHTGAVATDGITSDDRRFAAVWADLNRRRVVEVGETLEITMLDEGGNIVSGPFQRRIDIADIQKAYLSLPLIVGDVRPADTLLAQNFPNPFNPETWIPYQLKAPADITIQIYDGFGRVVQTLNLGLKPAGFYTTREAAAYWDGRNNAGEPVASGVYFYTLRTQDYTATRKMLILK